jgi:hypothetical protein
MSRNKDNLDFYSKFVYRIGRAKRSTSAAPVQAGKAPSGSADMPKIKEKRDSARQKVSEINKNVENAIAATRIEIGIFSWNKEQKAELAKLKKKRENVYTKFIEHIRDCKTKDIQKVQKGAMEELRRIAKEAREIVRLMEDRKKMVESLSKHSQEVKKEYLSKLPTYKNIEKKHLIMLLDSYLMRWENVNLKAIKNVGSKTIKLLRAHFDFDKSRFVRGRIYDDLQTIKKQIDKAIDYWKNDLPRKVYKNSDWDTNYWEKRDKWVDERMPFLSTISGGEEEFLKLRRQYYQQNPPPLPDWGGKGEDKITSPLVDSVESPQYYNELEADSTQIELDKKLLEHAKNLASTLNLAGSKKLNFVNPVLTQKRDAAKVSIMVKNKEIGDISLTRKAGKGEIFLSMKTLKKSVNIKPAELKKPKELVKKIEKMAFKPVVKEVKVNPNKKEVLLKGENLPGNPVSIDLSRAYVAVSKPVVAGKTDISLLPNTGNIEENLNSMVKEGLKDAMKDLPKDQKEAALKKIKDGEIKKLREKLFEKAKPTIVVTGGASMEGSLSRNKQLAKRRAESAKKKLLAQNPGIDKQYTIKTEGYVYGPDFLNINNLAKAEKDLVDKWNDEVATGKHKDEKVKNAKEIYAKLKNPKTHEKSFIDSHFKNVRNATMTIEPAKGKPAKLALKYEKPSSMVT